jgi:hypothetical protein
MYLDRLRSNPCIYYKIKKFRTKVSVLRGTYDTVYNFYNMFNEISRSLALFKQRPIELFKMTNINATPCTQNDKRECDGFP